MKDSVLESQQVYPVRDVDLLRVLVALAGRIAFPPEELSQIVGPYATAYNMCTGELTLAALAKATTIDKSNLRKAILRWEEAGVIFRVGPEGRPLRLYSISVTSGKGRDKKRTPSPSELQEILEGGVDGNEERPA